ncbi:CCR4-NOT transcription complex subunit 10-A-like, partial [Saccoglossus kowalevskii]
AQVYLEDVDNLEDIEHAILYYNHAVILYYLHQYKESARILEKLFQFIEPLDEVLVHKILFLLIEVYLCMYQPDKAVPGLAYLEKLVYGGNGKGDKASDNSKESSHRSPSPHQKYKLKLHM